MRWGRIVLAAIAATVFGIVWGKVMCGWLFQWVYLVPPVEVWKPAETYTGAFWAIVSVGSLVLNFLMAIVFGWLFSGLPGKCICCRGSAFGLMVWLVGVLPGMFSLYMFSTIAPTVIFYWAISGLVSLQIVGIIISAIYGKKGEQGEACC